MEKTDNKGKDLFFYSSPSLSSPTVSKTDSVIIGGGVPSLSMFSGAVLSDFNRLRGGARGTFKRIFIAVWNYLFNVSRLDDLQLYYYLPKVLEEHKIKPTTFFTLCRLWVYSLGGSVTVDSRKFKHNDHDNMRIKELMRMGLVTRSAFDPSSPYLIKNRCMQHVFITFTAKGVAFYKSVVKDLYNYAKDDMYRYFDK